MRLLLPLVYSPPRNPIKDERFLIVCSFLENKVVYWEASTSCAPHRQRPHSLGSHPLLGGYANPWTTLLMTMEATVKGPVVSWPGLRIIKSDPPSPWLTVEKGSMGRVIIPRDKKWLRCSTPLITSVSHSWRPFILLSLVASASLPPNPGSTRVQSWS